MSVTTYLMCVKIQQNSFQIPKFLPDSIIATLPVHV